MNSPIKKDKKNSSHPLRTEPFPVDPFTMSRMCYQSILMYLTNDGLIVSYTPTSLVSETCKTFLQYLPLTKKECKVICNKIIDFVENFGIRRS